jgi:pentatricopeptide repeat protein
MRLIDLHGLIPDLYSFNSLIKVCRIDNQWRCAFAQIREMQSYGIMPDIVRPLVCLFGFDVFPTDKLIRLVLTPSFTQ